MKQLKWLAIAMIFASCQKELSGEDGNIVVEDCVIDRISVIDTVANKSQRFLSVEFGNDFVSTRIVDYDSTNGTYDADVNFVKSGDTVKLNATEYYILDAANNNRVKKSFFSGTQMGLPFDPLFVYNYDANGNISSKVFAEAGFELVRIDYVWSGGNIVNASATMDLPGLGKLDLFNADYTYYSNLSVKNFLHLQADQDALYDLAFNFGKKPANALQTITTTYYDPFGGPDEVYSTTFYNYQLSADNKVISFVADNNDLSAFGVYQGKNQLRYLCK